MALLPTSTMTCRTGKWKALRCVVRTSSTRRCHFAAFLRATHALGGHIVFREHIRLFPRGQGRGFLQVAQELPRYLAEVSLMADAVAVRDGHPKAVRLRLQPDARELFLQTGDLLRQR